MRIRVLKVEGAEVKFSTSIGAAIATCEEKNLKEGSDFDVEFDILPDLVLGINAKKSAEQHLYFKTDGIHIFINALVESTYEDDEVCLRLADECIIMAYKKDNSINDGDTLMITLALAEFLVTRVGG